MKRIYLIIIATVFLFITLSIGLIIFFSNRQKNPPVKEETKIELKENESLVVDGSYETKQLLLEDPYINFEVKYPYFKNADLSFNLSIENFLKEQMENDRLVAKENWQARYDLQTSEDRIPEVPQPEDKFYFSSDYTVIQSNSKYISFLLNYGAFTGGAHGYEVKKSYNYDLENSCEIKLADMYKNNPDYLEKLSEISRKTLKEQYAVVSDEERENSDPLAIESYLENINSSIDSGTEPLEDNFNIFTFTKDGIKIYFAQYQVGPYVMGMPEVEIQGFAF
jgi:hypothetical protein